MWIPYISRDIVKQILLQQKVEMLVYLMAWHVWLTSWSGPKMDTPVPYSLLGKSHLNHIHIFIRQMSITLKRPFMNIFEVAGE